MLCTKCGEKPSDPERYMDCAEKTIMIRDSVCFTCAFWLNLMEEFKDDDMWAVIDGRSYHIIHVLQDGEKAVSQGYKTGFKGFGGAEFKIKFNDGRVIRTDDLWTQGELPEWVRELVPNNAEFVRG